MELANAGIQALLYRAAVPLSNKLHYLKLHIFDLQLGLSNKKAYS